MVLVTGGTGLVGSHILYLLLKDGQKVRAIHRKSSDLKAVLKVFNYYTNDAEKLYNQIEWKEANLNDIPALTDAFQDVEKVYHGAAYVSFDPNNFQKLKKSNIEGTANIVNLCLSKGVQKLCHISSIATLGNKGGNMADEESQWDPDADNNVYAITKYGAEMEVWRGAQEGLDAVIVNPGVILGSGFWNDGTGMIFKSVYKDLSYYTKGEVGFVDVIDVAEVSLKLMESSIKNERYILISENTGYKYLLSEIAKNFDKKPPSKELKPWMLQIAWRLDKLRSFVTTSKRKLFKSTANAIVQKRHFSNLKIKKELNYEFIPLAETISVTAKNYLNDVNSR
tara:strand:- start:112251 stop:113264 length:1014 start_codon:yes stop_codon:yes gene_type:complete